MKWLFKSIGTNLYFCNICMIRSVFCSKECSTSFCIQVNLGYDGPLYDGFLHMTDEMLGPSPMHIKYSSYVYDRFCI